MKENSVLKYFLHARYKEQCTNNEAGNDMLNGRQMLKLVAKPMAVSYNFSDEIWERNIQTQLSGGDSVSVRG